MVCGPDVVCGASVAPSTSRGTEEEAGLGDCAEGGGRPMYSLTRDFCSPVLPEVGAERAERVERTSGAWGEG